MKVVHVVGTRPNFVKIAPVHRALVRRDGVQSIVIHTGQHYDANMSGIFFSQLGIPEPDYNLAVGSGSHAFQTAEIMKKIEPVLQEIDPDMVLVYGDVNSTVAAALVCSKIGIRIGHVEAGLRSWDRTMPEEVNRVLTDQVSDLLLTPSPDAEANLNREGISSDKIRFVGNVMIDSLVSLQDRIEEGWQTMSEELGLTSGAYGLVTVHRPALVDDAARLSSFLDQIKSLSRSHRIVLPLHPRTASRMQRLLEDEGGNVAFIKPVGYLESLALQKHAAFVITDSGGLQEETTFLGVPCYTVRPNTERPITLTEGTNTLVGYDFERLHALVDAQATTDRIMRRPALWDGHTGERIVDEVLRFCAQTPANRG